MVEALGRVLDKVIGIFSPASGLRRTILRQYAAAKTNRLTGNWNPVGSNVNTIIGSSNIPVRNRVRQLVRDFPYFARAVNVLVNFTVGTGMQFQSKVRTPRGKADKALRQRIEDAFDFWADEADIAGKLHFYDIMRLTKRQDVECGEFLIAKVNSKDRSRYCPFALQVFESDWLSSHNDNYFEAGSIGSMGLNRSAGPVIWQGIEFSPQTGAVQAYHFEDPDGYGRIIRIPASDVIHGFDTLRPGQLRGISPFAPAVLVAHDLGDYMDAEIDAAKMAAKWLAFIETPDIGAFQGLRAGQDPSGSGKLIEDLENAIIEYMRPGEKVTLSAHNRPGDSFGPFTSLILRMVAVTVGISYELLSGDYQGLNYSVLRGIRNDLIKEFAPLQRRHERQFCRPVFRALMDSLVLSGRLNIPKYFMDPAPYMRSQWMAPGMPAVDPLKEGRANADAVDALNKSPQEVAAERGRDYEDILDEIADAREMQRARGLLVQPVSKSTKTNPASVMDGGDSADDQAA